MILGHSLIHASELKTRRAALREGGANAVCGEDYEIDQVKLFSMCVGLSKQANINIRSAEASRIYNN